MSNCPFCNIIEGNAPATDLSRYPNVVSFAPLNPVTEGHLLVVPEMHVPDAVTEPAVTGEVMRRAALIIRDQQLGSANIITSIGSSATQTVFHLHVHIVPRRPDDGLALPWDGGSYSDALREILGVCERSDAAPELKVAEIARRALGD